MIKEREKEDAIHISFIHRLNQQHMERIEVQSTASLFRISMQLIQSFCIYVGHSHLLLFSCARQCINRTIIRSFRQQKWKTSPKKSPNYCNKFVTLKMNTIDSSMNIFKSVSQTLSSIRLHSRMSIEFLLLRKSSSTGIEQFTQSSNT